MHYRATWIHSTAGNTTCTETNQQLEETKLAGTAQQPEVQGSQNNSMAERINNSGHGALANTQQQGEEENGSKPLVLNKPIYMLPGTYRLACKPAEDNKERPQHEKASRILRGSSLTGLACKPAEDNKERPANTKRLAEYYEGARLQGTSNNRSQRNSKVAKASKSAYNSAQLSALYQLTHAAQHARPFSSHLISFWDAVQLSRTLQFANSIQLSDQSIQNPSKLNPAYTHTGNPRTVLLKVVISRTAYSRKFLKANKTIPLSSEHCTGLVLAPAAAPQPSTTQCSNSSSHSSWSSLCTTQHTSANNLINPPFAHTQPAQP
ncbi:hypothetical protein F511_15836 [Dorcoceras hygrometricum]|uniref:Uncharacterized protein n=1 Tax=Dorcoceras hygrometricum TaxID=472368 RepID=A0A2Z7CG52_9LAMI|nr:hypothetical protein F511_15836 [Dorcoceras hygrometricum]